MAALVFILISLAGFLAYGMFRKSVFPEASIDMKITRSDASMRSKALANKLGYSTDGSIDSTIFDIDGDAKNVLEFNLGIEKANKLMQQEVPVWLWATRICKPLKKEEFYADWTVDGTLQRVKHVFDNDTKLPDLTHDQAQELAETFIKSEAHEDLSEYELFDQGTEKGVARTDHHFRWRKRKYEKSEMIVEVEVTGNALQFYEKSLSPFDSWKREYRHIRESNQLLGAIASMLMFVFIAVTIGAFVVGIMKHQLRWRFALSVSGIVGVLCIFDRWNDFSSTVYEYETSQSFEGFLLKTAAMNIAFGAFSFVSTMIMAGAGEYIYRISKPKEAAMEFVFNPLSRFSQSLLNRVTIGYLLCGVMFFWLISYYTMGSHFGCFCPLDVDDHRIIGTFCPALGGMLLGISAAGLEEVVCRVVAMSLIERVTKNFWLANFVQAIIWGFAHSAYPQQPCYARGVELTIVGLFFGWMFKRFGFIPVFLAHYLYDAFLTVQPIFTSGRIVQIILAVGILSPFTFSILRSKYFPSKVVETPRDLLNEEIVTVTPPHIQNVDLTIPKPPPYVALASPVRLLLAALLIIGIGVGISFKSTQMGETKRLTITKSDAINNAARFMKDENKNVEGYTAVADPNLNPDDDNRATMQFIYEQLGLSKTNELYNSLFPSIGYHVRYFKPGEPKEYNVYLNNDGTKRVILAKTLDGDEGAKPSRDEALKICTDYLVKNRPELGQPVLDSETVIKRNKRIDYKFSFLLPKLAVPGAPAETSMETKGDEISKLTLGWKIPDHWLREQQNETPLQTAANIFTIIVIAVVVLSSLIWGVVAFKGTHVPWKMTLLPIILAWVAVAIQVANKLQASLINYNTAENLDSFFVMQVATQSVGILLTLICCAFLAFSAVACLKSFFPIVYQRLADKWSMSLVIDAALGAYALAGCFMLLATLREWAISNFSPTVPLSIPGRLDTIQTTTFPPLEILCSTATNTVFGILILVIFASLIRRFTPTLTKILPLVFIMAVALNKLTNHPQDWLIGTGFMVLVLTTFYLFATRVFKSNFLAYIMSAIVVSSIAPLNILLHQGAPISQIEIGLTALLAALPLCIVCYQLCTRAK